VPRANEHSVASACGDGVRYVGSIVLARRQRLLSLFAAEGMAAVRAVNAAALVPFASMEPAAGSRRPRPGAGCRTARSGSVVALFCCGPARRYCDPEMGDRARQPRPSNLPAEVTSFVGRRQELREVKRLLTTTQLLTLTGSGGAGKTKLALRAAAEMSRGFAGGAWLVSPDSIRDPLLVTQAVFGALGVHDLSAGLSLSSLTDYLAGKRLLLLLDNCEHLLDACAVLASTLITSCPDLHVLATSRQALGVAGEVRMVVPPMSVPAEGEDTSVRRLLGYDAV
jgi:hypothetical protein